MVDVILITGFGPFGEHKINASWEAVKQLPDNIDGYKIVKENIHVEYNFVQERVPELWKMYNPKLVVHVGVSSYTNKIQLESCAHRKGYERIDVTGKMHSTGEACCTGQDCIRTDLNVDTICANMNKVGDIEACVSDNAGRFLCEFIYYTSLNIDRNKTLFVHVPPLNQPYTAQKLSQGLLNIIRFALDQKHATIYKNGRAAAFY